MSNFFLPIALVIVFLFFHLILKQLRLIKEVLDKIDESILRSNVSLEQIVDACDIEGAKSSQCLEDHKKMLETSKHNNDLHGNRIIIGLDNINETLLETQAWQISIHEFLKEMNQIMDCKKPKKAASPSKDPS